MMIRARSLVSISAAAMGILCLPVDGWIKGFMGIGLTFTVG